MMSASRTSLRRPAQARGAGRRPVLTFALVLPALLLALMALTRPAPTAAQPSDTSAESWRTALQAAPVTAGESPIFDFAGVILVPPSSSGLFDGWTVESAGSTDDGASYDITVDLAGGYAELRGSVGRSAYDEAVASAPPGCRTAEGRARGYCFRATPRYEYFPNLDVAGSPAFAIYGGFETNVGGHVELVWYDADLDTSYSVAIYGVDGAAARAGFRPKDDAARHVAPARDLAALAAAFIGI